MPDYPWYEIVEGKILAQGDIINSCPLINLPPKSNISEGTDLKVNVELYNVIVMSQSCDLELKKIDLVLVCPLWSLKEFQAKDTDYKSDKRLEQLRRGYIVGYHLLNRCELSNFESDYMIVDFRNVYSLPFDYISNFVENKGKRLRLLPPYREHLSQAFARFFMRVGLPTDIPSFVK